MAQNGMVHQSGQRSVLLAPTTITTAVTGVTTSVVKGLSGAYYLVVHCIFTYGSGGTTAKVWVQTSVDGGSTWTDIMSFAHTTASLSRYSAVVATTALAAVSALSDGALADNTIVSGLLGDRIRLKYTTTGTYGGGTTVALYSIAKG